MAKEDPLDLVSDWDALKPNPTPGSKPARAQAGVLDVNELRRATEKAIQEGAEKKRAAEELKVAAILQKATARARKEAAQGKTSCRVIKLQYDKDYSYIGEGRSQNKSMELKGPAKLVLEKLLASKLQVDFERHNTTGSYFDEDVWIILKW